MEDLFSSVPSVLQDLYVCSNSIISLSTPYYSVLLMNVSKFIIFFFFGHINIYIFLDVVAPGELSKKVISISISWFYL